MSVPRFAFSNIAWSPHDDRNTLALLRSHGVTGIEIAPTTVWEGWAGSTRSAAAAYGAFLRDEGFEVPALQALLYARPEARLFDEQGEALLLEHLAHVAELAGGLGARVAVLGAPRQRDRGRRSFEQARDEAVPVLRQAAQRFHDQGACLCVEPNPRDYGCNFVCSAGEGAQLVAAVNHAGFGLHLDAGGLYLEREELAGVLPQVEGILRHFHVSEPHLGDFRTPRAPHAANLRCLAERGYTGWCSVEMRRPSAPLAAVGPWGILSDARGGHG